MADGRLTTAVILAAGQGTRIGAHTRGLIPKGLMLINGRSLVERSIEKLVARGMQRIVLVTGQGAEIYENLLRGRPEILLVRNPDFRGGGSMASLARAAPFLDSPFLLLESDLLYENLALDLLVGSGIDECILLTDATTHGDEVYAETRGQSIVKLSKNRGELGMVLGQFTGLSVVSPPLLAAMMGILRKATDSTYPYEYALSDAAAVMHVGYVLAENLVWAEIDTPGDLERAATTTVPLLIASGEESPFTAAAGSPPGPLFQRQPLP